MEEEQNNITHHYIIAVKCYDATHSKAGQFHMKYRPIYWTNKDRDNLYDAIQLSKDELFPSGISMNEALDIKDCSQLVHDLNSLKYSAQANSCTVHHFKSEYEIEEEWFDMIVENYEINKQLLKNSKVIL